MMDALSVQNALAASGFYKGKLDGDYGDISHDAGVALLKSKKINVDGWTRQRTRVAVEQSILRDLGFYPKASALDGLAGPNTRDAWDRWQTAQRKVSIPKKVADILSSTPTTVKNVWPTQAQLVTESESYYGRHGVPGGYSPPMTKVPLPWKASLTWDPSAKVTSITIHTKVAKSLERVLGRIYSEIGEEKIVDLGLHRFSGSYNPRKMRGSTAWSMHAWAIAIDFDDTSNQLHWGKDRARLGKDDAIPMWSIWESEGWLSLGRARNYDWMHVQAARL